MKLSELKERTIKIWGDGDAGILALILQGYNCAYIAGMKDGVDGVTDTLDEFYGDEEDEEGGEK